MVKNIPFFGLLSTLLLTLASFSAQAAVECKAGSALGNDEPVYLDMKVSSDPFMTSHSAQIKRIGAEFIAVEIDSSAVSLTIVVGEKILATTQAAFLKSEITGEIEAQLGAISSRAGKDLFLTLSCIRK